MQFGTALRNARGNTIETTVGTSPILEIRTGAPPATPATADSGTLLASMTLPSDWLGAASGGVKSLAGTWEDASANASGTPGHYRIWDSGRTVTHIQGTCTGPTVGTGELLLDVDTITAGQPVTVTAWAMTEGNA
jgi:hypothetical protein